MPIFVDSNPSSDFFVFFGIWGFGNFGILHFGFYDLGFSDFGFTNLEFSDSESFWVWSLFSAKILKSGLVESRFLGLGVKGGRSPHSYKPLRNLSLVLLEPQNPDF